MNKHLWNITWVAVFAAAFAFVESSVVVYLRALYYPEGFAFPLKALNRHHVLVELCRELSTLVMLVSVGMLAGKNRWQRFAYFMIAFGVWDILYYIWLKVLLDWPASLFEWDVLFLIPLPWIGPVIAPILISILMIVGGLFVVRADDPEGTFHPSVSEWILCTVATAVILFSFVSDFGATLQLHAPKPYPYMLLALGLVLYALALLLTMRNATQKQDSSHR